MSKTPLQRSDYDSKAEVGYAPQPRLAPYRLLSSSRPTDFSTRSNESPTRASDGANHSPADADFRLSMSAPNLLTRARRSSSSVFRGPEALTLSRAFFIASTRACISATNLSRLEVNGSVLTRSPRAAATRDVFGGPGGGASP